MAPVTAKYTSPTHSLNVAHPVNSSSDAPQKTSLEALRRAILSMKADLNDFLTERKLEEDRASGINGTSSKRPEDEDEDEDEGEDHDAGEDEE